MQTSWLSAVQYFVREPLRAARRVWLRARLSSHGALVGSSVLIDIDPGCDIVLGNPCSIGAGTILLAKQATGNHYTLRIGNDVAIHGYNNLRACGGDITIGDHCQIAQHCTLVAANHEVDTAELIIRAPLNRRKHSIVLEEDVWIGSNVNHGVGRTRTIKLGARVVASVRRIAVHLPESFPWRSDFQKIAAALGTTAG